MSLLSNLLGNKNNRLNAIAKVIVATHYSDYPYAPELRVGSLVEDWDALGFKAISDGWFDAAMDTERVVQQRLLTPDDETTVTKSVEESIKDMIRHRLPWFFKNEPQFSYDKALEWTLVSNYFAVANRAFLPEPEPERDVSMSMGSVLRFTPRNTAYNIGTNAAHS